MDGTGNLASMGKSRPWCRRFLRQWFLLGGWFHRLGDLVRRLGDWVCRGWFLRLHRCCYSDRRDRQVRPRPGLAAESPVRPRYCCFHCRDRRGRLLRRLEEVLLQYYCCFRYCYFDSGPGEMRSQHYPQNLSRCNVYRFQP